MMVSLINIALFLLVVLFLIPLLVYSVYVYGFTKHFQDRGFWNQHNTDIAIRH